MSLPELNLQEHENLFMQLPDDLLILILTKIGQHDFKFLFGCSLISKQFASAIPLMPSVSISISPPKSLKPTSDYEQDIDDRGFRRKVDYWISLQPQIQNALTFLKKFNSIQSLDVVFITDDEEDAQKQEIFSPALINWKTQFDFKLQRLIFLFANTKTEEREAAIGLRLCSSLYNSSDSVRWGNVTWRLLVQHPTIGEIRVGGLKPGGEIRLKGQQIVDLRNSLSPADLSSIAENRDYKGSKVSIKSAYVPVLCLPATGYVMHSVSVVVIRAQPVEDDEDDNNGDNEEEDDNGDAEDEEDGDDEDNDDGDEEDGDDEDNDNGDEEEDDDILNWDCDEGDEVFREAVTMMLKYHKDKKKRESLNY